MRAMRVNSQLLKAKRFKMGAQTKILLISTIGNRCLDSLARVMIGR